MSNFSFFFWLSVQGDKKFGLIELDSSNKVAVEGVSTNMSDDECFISS